MVWAGKSTKNLGHCHSQNSDRRYEEFISSALLAAYVWGSCSFIHLSLLLQICYSSLNARAQQAHL